MFIKQAQLGNNKWWTYLVMILSLAVVYLIIGPLPLTFYLLATGLGPDELIALQENMDFSAAGIDENIGLLLLLLIFVASFFTILVLYRPLHAKPIKAMLTTRSQLDWSRVFFSFALWFGLTMGIEVALYALEPENYVFQLEWSKFIPLLLIALLILPMQTSFEELLFRGYLLQGFSLITKFRWMPILITSVLFGLMHGFNPEVQEFGLAKMMPYYIGVGLMLAICTVMDDGLEIALGAHAATNIYGATLVTFSSSALQTPAIFSLQEVRVDLMLPLSLVTAILFVFLVARKYKWSDWTKLTGPIEFDEPEAVAEAAL